MRNLLSILDLSREELLGLIDRTIEFKAGRSVRPLEGKSVALVFQKPSTRTRVSFEVAVTQLGGHPIYLGWGDLQLGRGETIADTARVLSRYVDVVVMRLFKHADLLEFSRHSTVPVINALTDVEHPCQIIADLVTLKERFGRLEGLKISWVGDGNNVCNSLALACSLLGLHLTLAIPEGFEPNLLGRALEVAKRSGSKVELLHEPEKAVRGADAIYTDVFVSMGQEAEAERRRAIFYPKYQVNRALLSLAKPEAVVMHCQPWRIGEEISEEVAYSERCVAFQQAENRLHSSKSILEFCLTPSRPSA
ncbi:MAG: ornithine carbamoyltransferase [Candidatus Hadarchaeales archaeon]